MLTRDEVIWAFRYCLGRDPESETAVIAQCSLVHHPNNQAFPKTSAQHKRAPGRRIRLGQVSADGRRKWRLLREQIGQIIRARTANFIDLPGQHEGARP
jgi:hypothetical protein